MAALPHPGVYVDGLDLSPGTVAAAVQDITQAIREAVRELRGYDLMAGGVVTHESGVGEITFVLDGVPGSAGRMRDVEEWLRDRVPATLLFHGREHGQLREVQPHPLRAGSARIPRGSGQLQRRRVFNLPADPVARAAADAAVRLGGWDALDGFP